MNLDDVHNLAVQFYSLQNCYCSRELLHRSRTRSPYRQKEQNCCGLAMLKIRVWLLMFYELESQELLTHMLLSVVRLLISILSFLVIFH